MRTIIVDDEALAVERLTILCAALDDIIVVGTASDGEAALRLIEEVGPDLVLLDISMPELDGLGLARVLETLSAAPAIVFCTAFDHFAVEAFDVAAADYLLKPVTRDRLARAVARVSAGQRQAGAAPRSASGWAEAFWVPHRGEFVRIAALDIDRVEADRDYMRLHVGGRTFLLHQTITRLEQRLDPTCFIRVHRSHIVQRDRVARLAHDGLGAWTIHLADGTALRVGRSYLAEVKLMTARR
ncbi:MAG: LytTR family DNA-binding domain-containing protein [Pseudomonadota bacterium]|nr:LytTR family DNA-binding domain-containing protein [Pseudomonadota bacterium]